MIENTVDRMKKNNNKKLVFLLLACLEGSWFLVLNFLTPLIADDLDMKTNFFSLSDIFSRLYSYYNYTAGRVVAHFFAFFFLSFDKWVFNIANTIIFVVFMRLVFFHSMYGTELEKKKRALCYIIMHAVMFVFIVSWGQVFLWLDGSCNYLWTLTVMLGFLYFFRKIFSGDMKQSKNLIMMFAMLLFGIVAGWCNENTSGGILLITLLLICVGGFLRKKLNASLYTGIGGLVIGLSLQILSPGNHVRENSFNDMSNTADSFIKQVSVKLVQSYIPDYFNNYKILIIALGIVFALLIYFKVPKRKLITPVIFFVASLATCGALAMTPGYIILPGRAFFGSSVFLIIALINSLGILISSEERCTALAASFMGALTVVAMFNFCLGFVDIVYFGRHTYFRQQFIEEQINMGYDDPVIFMLNKPASKYTAGCGLDDISNDPKDWTALAFAKYYGASSVTGVENDIWQRVFGDGDYKLNNCRDIYEYLELINDPNYMVIMAVNDDSSGAVDEKIVELMKKLGLKTDLRENFRWSYYAIIDGGNVIAEEYANDVLNYYEKLGDHFVEVQSSGKIYNKGNIASIKIDDYEYSRNSLGLNIVVFDKSKDKVVDRVTFDTWESLEARR